VALSRYYPGIGLEELTKTTKYLSHDSQCSGRDSNTAPPDYESKRYRYARPLGTNILMRSLHEVRLCVK
jgi:hypothetical protein